MRGLNDKVSETCTLIFISQARNMYTNCGKLTLDFVERISTILGASGQSLPDVLNPGTSKIKASAYHPSAEIPDDFNLSMENGTFVFSPTKSVLEDFPRFLEVVENVAGREQGVVKVVIPFQWYVWRDRVLVKPWLIGVSLF